MSGPASANRIVREVNLDMAIADIRNNLSTTVDLNQGDLVILDTSAHQIILPTAETDATTFLGISVVKIVDGKLASPYTGVATDAAEAQGGIPGPACGVECSLVGKTSDDFEPGVPVYLYPTGGAYHVSVSGTKPIGHYVGKAIASNPAGGFVTCRIGRRYPGDTLQNG